MRGEEKPWRDFFICAGEVDIGEEICNGKEIKNPKKLKKKAEERERERGKA